MSNELGAAYLTEVAEGYRALKRAADEAIGQIDDEALFARLDPESNSIDVLMRHLSGNMRSRWKDFLATDGEKPDRDRDGEFEDSLAPTRAALLAEWERGWQVLHSAIAALTAEDLMRPVRIRGETYLALGAIERATRHYAQHVGQIVLLAKHAKGPAWRTLSIPRARR